MEINPILRDIANYVINPAEHAFFLAVHSVIILIIQYMIYIFFNLII
jgi:hypothetical protein